MLSSRGFNIDSLTVSKTNVAELSRMTIVLHGADAQFEQARVRLPPARRGSLCSPSFVPELWSSPWTLLALYRPGASWRTSLTCGP